MDIVQYSLVNTQMFSICCIHCIASTVHTKRNAISPLTESLYVGLVENWGNAHKTVMWVHFGLVQICPNPEIYCHFIRQHRVQTSLFPQNCLSSSHFPPNVPKFLACWQIPPKKCIQFAIQSPTSQLHLEGCPGPWPALCPTAGAVAPALMQNTGGIAARSSAVDQKWLQRRSLAE
jgi:hypothetical protein